MNANTDPAAWLDQPLELIPSSGESVHIVKRWIRRCPYFENRLNERRHLRKYRTKASRETLDYFRAYVEQRELPLLENGFDSIVFGCRIQYREFVQNCVWTAVSIWPPSDTQSPPHRRSRFARLAQSLARALTAPWRVIRCSLPVLLLHPPVPSTLRDIVTVAEACIEHLPLRTCAAYYELVYLLTPHLSDEHRVLLPLVTTDAVRRKRTVTQPLPLPMFQRMVTVGLFCDGVAFLYDNEWYPFEMFGWNFDPFREAVRNFHLVLDRYVVFERRDGAVLLKDIRSKDPARLILGRCKFFGSREGRLHVVRYDESRQADVVYEWDDAKQRFDERYHSVGIKSAGLNEVGELVAVLRDDAMYNVDAERTECGLRIVGGRRYQGSTLRWNFWERHDSPTSGGTAGCARHIEDRAPTYVGHSVLSVVNPQPDVYLTEVWGRVGDHWRIVGSTQPHSRVISISDVFLRSY